MNMFSSKKGTFSFVQDNSSFQGMILLLSQMRETFEINLRLFSKTILPFLPSRLTSAQKI